MDKATDPQPMHTDLAAIYQTLEAAFGRPRNWWPIFGDDPPFEMLLGAILVQQTRWEKVEAAILNLRGAGVLHAPALAQAPVETVIDAIRPTAYYRQKAPGIITLSAYLCEQYAGDARRLLAQPTDDLRRELLALPRIGNETADVMLLYAGEHPVFVVDDYTRRLFGRINPDPPFDWARAKYDRMRATIEQQLQPLADSNEHDLTRLFADYHALINEQCVRYCVARRPRCDGPPSRRVYSIQSGRESYLEREEGCPLRGVCGFYQNDQG